MLSVIVRNFENSEVTLKCLKSLFKYPPRCGLEVFLVDDGRLNDESTRNLQRQLSNIRILKLGDAIGISGANNAAGDLAKGECLLFLNGDTRILEGSLDGMLDVLNTDPKIGILGPRQLDSWGRLQRASGPFPTLAEILFKDLTAFQTIRKPGLLLDKNNDKKKNWEDTDWVSGSCLLARRQTLSDVGGWDENFFLYFEDIDLCRRVRKAGWRVCASFDMKTSVINHGGAGVVRNMLRTELEYRRSQTHFVGKYYGREGLLKFRLSLLARAAALLPLSGFIFLFSKAAGREATISTGKLLLAKKTIELAWTPC